MRAATSGALPDAGASTRPPQREGSRRGRDARGRALRGRRPRRQEPIEHPPGSLRRRVGEIVELRRRPPEGLEAREIVETGDESLALPGAKPLQKLGSQRREVRLSFVVRDGPG